MKPLVLTGWSIPGFIESGFADLAVDFFYRFIWGPLPSPDELAAYLGSRAPNRASGMHWSDFANSWKRSSNRAQRDLGLAEFCLHYETIELWFDMRPSAQLKLIWLLDYFRSTPEVLPRLRLRMVDREMFELHLDGFEQWRPFARTVTETILQPRGRRGRPIERRHRKPALICSRRI